MGSMTVLNRTGDSTLAWSDENNDKVRAVIEKKMAEGWSFFILEPRLGGWATPKKTALKKFKDLPADARTISMGDTDFLTLLQEGFAGSAGRNDGEMKTIARAKTAGEAASADTVAVQPRRGG